MFYVNQLDVPCIVGRSRIKYNKRCGIFPLRTVYVFPFTACFILFTHGYALLITPHGYALLITPHGFALLITPHGYALKMLPHGYALKMLTHG